jgi:zinc/manganese transport system permease protein
MFTYDFMQNAFAAAFVVALACGATGYVLVLRQQSFAGHALGHVGFAGATGALLLGVPPLWGLMAATVCCGALMGALGERLATRDVAVGMVLSVSLGAGLLFLHFFTSGATQATSLLFGNVLGIDGATVWRMAVVALITLACLAMLSRPLLLATIRPELAEAKGADLRLVSMLFLALVGIAVAEAVQVVGVLLVFTLMVGPAATAQNITARLWPGVGLSVALAAAQALAGIALAYLTDWPASFWITVLSAAAYLMTFGEGRSAVLRKGNRRFLRAPSRTGQDRSSKAFWWFPKKNMLP